MLEVRGLGLQVGSGGSRRRLFSDVHFRLARGEMLALCGPSGCGKSLLGRALIGLLPGGAVLSAGSIHWQGRALQDLDEPEWSPLRGSVLAHLAQDPQLSLHPTRSIGSQLREAARRARRRPGEPGAVAGWQCLRAVGLPPGRRLLAARVRQLSNGQRQRVALALALTAGPAVLIADEPTAALDPATRDQVFALLEREGRERGLAVLLITHDGELAGRCGRRLHLAPSRGAAPVRPAISRLGLSAAGDDGRPAMLELQDVAKSYPRKRGPAIPALAGIDLRVAAGECVAVVGPSGSGKTTLARCAAALTRPDRGQVLCQGRELGSLSATDLRRLRPSLQLLLPDAAGSFDPRRSLAASLRDPLRSLSPERASRRIADRCRDLELALALLSRRPGELSGGQLRRAALARVWSVEPQVLVVDEAFNGLAATQKLRIARRLRAWCHFRRAALLFCEHDLDTVQAIADRVLVLDGGHIRDVGRPGRILPVLRHRIGGPGAERNFLDDGS